MDLSNKNCTTREYCKINYMIDFVERLSMYGSSDYSEYGVLLLDFEQIISKYFSNNQCVENPILVDCSSSDGGLQFTVKFEIFLENIEVLNKEEEEENGDSSRATVKQLVSADSLQALPSSPFAPLSHQNDILSVILSYSVNYKHEFFTNLLLVSRNWYQLASTSLNETWKSCFKTLFPIVYHNGDNESQSSSAASENWYSKLCTRLCSNYPCKLPLYSVFSREKLKKILKPEQVASLTVFKLPTTSSKSGLELNDRIIKQALLLTMLLECEVAKLSNIEFLMKTVDTYKMDNAETVAVTISSLLDELLIDFKEIFSATFDLTYNSMHINFKNLCKNSVIQELHQVSEETRQFFRAANKSLSSSVVGAPSLSVREFHLKCFSFLMFRGAQKSLHTFYNESTMSTRTTCEIEYKAMYCKELNVLVFEQKVSADKLYL